MSDVVINRKDKVFLPYRDKRFHLNQEKDNTPIRLGGDLNLAVMEGIPHDSDRSNIQKESKSMMKTKNHLPPFIDPEWEALINDDIESVKIPSKLTGIKKKSIHDPINFWFEDPKSLFQTFDTIPCDNMSNAERLNAMTRMIIIITAIMFAIRFPLWWLFLGLGLLVVIILWYMIKGYEEVYANQIRRQREYLRRPRGSIIHPVNNIVQPIKRETFNQRIILMTNRENIGINNIRQNYPLNIVSPERRL